MLPALVKIAAPLVLLLALFFFTGTASAAVSLMGKAKADLCCDHGGDEQAPPVGDECTDPACGCISCSASILSQEFLIASVIFDCRPATGAPAGSMPPGHGRSIDYPPEHPRS